MTTHSAASRSHDVVIVGGGPAGLYAASQLARSGLDVVLLEEHREVGEPVHCTGVFAAEAYDELDIPREAVLNSLSQVNFIAPSGEVVSYTTPAIEALVIDRRLFDHLLHKRAVSTGVTMKTGTRVSDIGLDPHGVSVTCVGGLVLRARACILACGANYTFQRRLGLGMPSVFLQSAQVEWPATPNECVEVHFGDGVAPRGFAWAVPVKRGPSSFARIGLMCDGAAASHFRAFADRIRDRWGTPDHLDEAAEPRLKMLPLAPIRRSFTHRTLAIGDAAGIVKATTGGGIYYSLLSAKMAADVLAEQLASDHLSDRDLAQYERLWRKRLGPELKAQLSLRLLANRLSDGEINELFELAKTDGIMPIVRRTARFNQHRDLILSLLKHPPARRVFFRRLTHRSSAST